MKQLLRIRLTQLPLSSIVLENGEFSQRLPEPFVANLYEKTTGKPWMPPSDCTPEEGKQIILDAMEWCHSVWIEFWTDEEGDK